MANKFIYSVCPCVSSRSHHKKALEKQGMWYKACEKKNTQRNNGLNVHEQEKI